MVQEFIKESAGTDIRAFVVGSKVVASMKRNAPEGEFRSNVHRGSTIQNITLTNEESLIAVNAAKTLGLSIAGVDLMRSDRGPLILEVNSSPGLQGIETCSKVDVSSRQNDHFGRRVGKTRTKRRYMQKARDIAQSEEL